MNKKGKDLKICIIYNYAQHYRLAIFQLLDKEFDCDFYFGDRMKEMKDIKKLDYSLLPGFKRELKNISLISHFYWQKGAVSLFFKNYDKYIILGEYYCLSTWIILLLGKVFGKKIYLWSHGWYGNENKIKRFIKRIFFKLSNEVFLYGNHARNLMIKEGCSAERLHVIYNSLYYTEQVQIRNKLMISSIYDNHFKNQNPVILFIGRLTKEKMLDMILQAQNILSDKNIFANVVIIGSGEEEMNLKKMMVALKNINCWFYGPCYDEQKIGELIYNATICVSPGNVGLTAVHSMVFGTPVISHNDFASQGPEFEAIIAGETGDYFKKGNVEDLARVIEIWIAPKAINQREMVRKLCYKVVDEKFNPYYQLKVFMKVMNSSKN